MSSDDDLLALCTAATPGGWYRNSGLIWGNDDRVVTDTRNLSHDDAAFIAAFSPDVVAGLIQDRIELFALRGGVEALADTIDLSITSKYAPDDSYVGEYIRVERLRSLLAPVEGTNDEGGK